MIQMLMDNYTESIKKRDQARFLELYHDEVVVNDSYGAWSFHGKSEWAKTVEGWFSQPPSESENIVFHDYVLRESAKLKLFQSLVDFHHSSGITTLRLSWVVALVDGKWLIRHEHTSSPIDMNTLEAVTTTA